MTQKPSYSESDTDQEELWDQDSDTQSEEAIPPGRLQLKRPTALDLQPSVVLYSLFAIVSVLSWSDWTDVSFWISQQSVLDKNEYWRLVTALAAHADWAHLFSNIPLFFIFGWFLKTWFGYWGFPLIPLMTGILTNFLTVLFYPAEVRLLGASGMIYGMAAQWIIYYLYYENRFSVSMKLVRSIGFCLVLLFPSTFQPQTSYLAHGIGFITGGIFGASSLFFYSSQKMGSNDSPDI